MGHRTERIRGLLRDDRDHLLLLSLNCEPGSGAYELGVLDYGRDHLFCGRLLSDLCEEGVQGSCGGDCAVPDVIETNACIFLRSTVLGLQSLVSRVGSCAFARTLYFLAEFATGSKT